jgi:adenine-specific DNA-methyltransferase
MSRPTSIHYELSDTEKRDLIALIQAGKPLPEKYRFLLFADKREVELVWNGKTREVCTAVLPFQILEHIDEPRAEEPEDTPPQLDLFDDPGPPASPAGPTNSSGATTSSSSPASRAAPCASTSKNHGGLKLIYIDPPFDVGADFSMDIEIGGETFHEGRPAFPRSRSPTATPGARVRIRFLAMMYERLVLMRDLLADEWKQSSCIAIGMWTEDCVR